MRDVNGNAKFKKKVGYGITWQVSIPMLLSMIMCMFILSIVVTVVNVYMNMHERTDHARMVALYASGELSSYNSLDYLVDYWDEHYEEMDLLYNWTDIHEKERNLRRLWPAMRDIRAVSREDLLNQNEAIQKSYAEVAYGYLCKGFGRVKKVFSPKYLYSFVVRGDMMHFLITGTLEGEKHISEGGDIFELGSRDTYVKGRYTLLDDLIESGGKVEGVDASLDRPEDQQTIHYFVPVFSGDEFVAIVGVAMDTSDLLTRGFKVIVVEIIISCLLLFLNALIIARKLRKKAVEPLRATEKAVFEYEKTKDANTAIESLSSIKPNNEVQSLSVGFASMVKELERYIEEVRQVTADKERIGAELNVATQIQADMLPNIFPAFPDRTEFDLYATMDPAKEVGGDFYDFFLLDDKHLGLVIADVSGKGVPAALFMVISKTLIKNRALLGGEPKDIIHDVNNQLCEGNELGYFVTVWFAIVDLETGKGVSINAGHEHPTICRAGKQYEFVVYPHSPALGLIEELRFKQREFQLFPGDRIFVYTDGVPEATNNNKVLMGEERLKEALDASDVKDSVNVLQTVTDYLNEFVDGAEQFDDITMLTFLYKGPKENESNTQ